MLVHRPLCPGWSEWIKFSRVTPTGIHRSSTHTHTCFAAIQHASSCGQRTWLSSRLPGNSTSRQWAQGPGPSTPTRPPQQTHHPRLLAQISASATPVVVAPAVATSTRIPHWTPSTSHTRRERGKAPRTASSENEQLPQWAPLQQSAYRATFNALHFDSNSPSRPAGGNITTHLDSKGFAIANKFSTVLSALRHLHSTFTRLHRQRPLKDRRFQHGGSPCSHTPHLLHISSINHVPVQAHRSSNKKKLVQLTTMATRFRSSLRLVSRQATLRAQTVSRTVALGARAPMSTSLPTHHAAAPHGEIAFTADKFPHMKRSSAFKKVRIQML